jgi:hypothetical protein
MKKLTKNTYYRVSFIAFFAVFVIFTMFSIVSTNKAEAEVEAGACDGCLKNVEISCFPDKTNVDINKSVTWRAYAKYGTGYYKYSWSGTDNLSSYSDHVTKTYSTTGAKTAQVAVTSGGKTFYKDCGSVVVEKKQDPVLTGSCSVDKSKVYVGDSVLWSSNVSGGNGSYTYSWSGGEGLTGSRAYVSKKYSTAGTKYGILTIRSGKQSITKDCGSVVVEKKQDPVLTGSCSANTSKAYVGDSVLWSSNVSGGNGSYTYSWSGGEGLTGDKAYVSKKYSNIGTKHGILTIRSGNQTIKKDCGAVVVEYLWCEPGKSE